MPAIVVVGGPPEVENFGASLVVAEADGEGGDEGDELVVVGIGAFVWDCGLFVGCAVACEGFCLFSLYKAEPADHFTETASSRPLRSVET